MKSERVESLAASLAKAQGEMKPALFDSVNPHFRSKYASLASVWDAVRAPLSKHGLSVLQRFELQGDRLILVTQLAHESGEWVESVYPIEPVKHDPQGYGSAITYARRYALAALLGVVSDSDDDANAASQPKAPQPPVKAPQAAKFREPGPGTYTVTLNLATAASDQPKAAPEDSSSFVPATGYLKGKPLAERSDIELEGYILDVTAKLNEAGKTVEQMSPAGRKVLDMVTAEAAKRAARPLVAIEDQPTFDVFGGVNG